MAEIHNDDDYKGVLVGGLAAGVNKGGLEGFCFGGVMSYLEDGLNGLSVGGLFSVSQGDLNGLGIGGLSSYVDGTLNGFSYGTFYNGACENGKGSLQIGLINILKDYEYDGASVQVGLYNRIGDQTIPLVNVRGLKNLFKKKSD